MAARHGSIRPALLAGRWYPAEPDACRLAIDEAAQGADPGGVGLIGPHAGWSYSGACAGLGYAGLARSRAGADLVVVFGSHRGPAGPDTLFGGEAWDTPLGPLETDRELAREIAEALPLEPEPVRPAQADNAVELHLPFVRRLFPDARLLMLGVAAAPGALAIGRWVGERVRARGRRAAFVGSTDLTHYGPSYGWAPRGTSDEAVRWVREVNDAGFLDAVLADRPEAALAHALEERSACCPGAVAATMEAVRAYAGEVTPRLVDHRLSYDVRPAESFVGYASVAL